MSSNPASPESDPPGAAEFASTRWSIVLTAGERHSPDSEEALADLCRSYWYPLYAYVRRRVRDPHEAQDLVQEFFSRLLERNTVAVADPQRGRFRAFLLTSLRNFLAGQWDQAKAQKRGGGRTTLSLDFAGAASRELLEPADRLTPERLYDQQWARMLLQRVLTGLRETFARAGKQKQFDELKVFLAGRHAQASYAAAAVRLGISQGAAMVAAHRLRRRYRELLRAEIAQTVADPGEVEDEIRSLFASFAS